MSLEINLRRCGLVLLVAAIAVFAWVRPIDESARVQVKEDLARALKVFAAARALESGLAVALSIKLDLKILGPGVEVSPTQVLLPVKEFVERFAGLMLAASVAFGIQLFLLHIGAHWVVSASLLLVAIVVLLAYWRRSSQPVPLLPALLLFLLVLRFAVPLSAAANGLIYTAVMKAEYESAVSVIEKASDRPEGEAKERKGGLLDMVKDWYERTKVWLNNIDSVRKAASDWADKMVRLLALFALQTIVFPLGSLWLFWRVCKSAVQSLAPARVQV